MLLPNGPSSFSVRSISPMPVSMGSRSALSRRFSAAIEALPATVPNTECANYLVNAGYASAKSHHALTQLQLSLTPVVPDGLGSET